MDLVQIWEYVQKMIRYYIYPTREDRYEEQYKLLYTFQNDEPDGL